jgi:hypothetical protein
VETAAVVAIKEGTDKSLLITCLAKIPPENHPIFPVGGMAGVGSGLPGSTQLKKVGEAGAEMVA